MKKLFLLILLSYINSTFATVRVAKIFNNHMVLQRNASIKIWGWADASEKIILTFSDQKKSIKADKQGKWLVILDPLQAGGPFTLTIKGNNTIVINDVLVGEVWLCSGQSNMAWAVKDTHKAKEEIPTANYAMIRHFKVKEEMKGSPTSDLSEGEWTVCSPETVGNFTGVGYYFAKNLFKELNVPIGIINASWGGTYIEGWMSYDALHGLSDYKEMPQLTDAKLADWFLGVENLYKEYAKSLGIADLSEYKTTDTNWKDENYDDRSWIKIPFPGNFDAKVLPRFDGTVWFRTEFDIPQGISLDGLTLKLGRIDDLDETFVNGKKIGATEGALKSRNYKIQAGDLKVGKNLLAIKITDYWEAGGFLDASETILLENGNGFKLPLASLPWKMNFSQVIRLWIRSPNVHPNLLFNGMINPIVPYTIKGALWYQGENNADFAYQYRTLLPALIKDWRSQWGIIDLPFYSVQLPNYQKFNTNSVNGGSKWAELREAFTKTLSVPNTGMAVILDLGDSTDIHPTNKLDVGNRLSFIALNKLYGKQVAFAAPEVDAIRFIEDKALITLKGRNLMVKDKYGYIKGFEIAGEDQNFFLAQASILDSEIIVKSNNVKKPVAVRYAWSDNPDANLISLERLPVAPFRSDDWPMITLNKKFEYWIGKWYK